MTLYVQTQTTIEVTFRNFGNQNLTSLEIEYSIVVQDLP